MADPKKPKKISRTQVSKLSSAEQWELTKDVYGKLYRYMEPFRKRLFIGIFLSVISGLFSVVILAGLNLVFTIVLAGNHDKEPAPAAIVAPAGLSDRADARADAMARRRALRAGRVGEDV
mgnify:CR=1 FL=1